jgi:hypothetical protein
MSILPPLALLLYLSATTLSECQGQLHVAAEG